MAESKPNSGSALKYPTITYAELAGGYFSKHVVFVIRTLSEDVIRRRYTDFEWLRAWLTNYYPGAFIPPIPPKLPVAMWPTGYLLSRKRELQQFLQRIQIIKYLEQEEIVKFFLTRSPNGEFDKARKLWDKNHRKPSPKAQFDNLVSKFPTIAEQKMPEDMPDRCKRSKEDMDKCIKFLEKLVHSCERFIRGSENVERSMHEFIDALQGLYDIENLGVSGGVALKSQMKYCTQARLPVTKQIAEWQGYRQQEYLTLRNFVLPVLKRSLFDTLVVRDLIATRDDLHKEYEKAKGTAAKWHSQDAMQNLRSAQIAAKHSDIMREEHYKQLSDMVDKLVLNQLRIVWEANIRRFTRSSDTFINNNIEMLKKFGNACETLESLGTQSQLLSSALDAGSPAKVHVSDPETADEKEDPESTDIIVDKPIQVTTPEKQGAANEDIIVLADNFEEESEEELKKPEEQANTDTPQEVDVSTETPNGDKNIPEEAAVEAEEEQPDLQAHVQDQPDSALEPEPEPEPEPEAEPEAEPEPKAELKSIHTVKSIFDEDLTAKEETKKPKSIFDDESQEDEDRNIFEMTPDEVPPPTGDDAVDVPTDTVQVDTEKEAVEDVDLS